MEQDEMPGPPPKSPDQRRRRNVPKLTQLPADGRKGRTPKWPFATADDHERKLWAELWRTPQAVMWERTNAHREVAAYVRWSLAAEAGDLRAAPEARQLSDRLGLTPLALRRLEWEIVEATEAKQSTVPASNVRRLRAVDPVAS